MSHLWVCILSDCAVFECRRVESARACESAKVRRLAVQKGGHVCKMCVSMEAQGDGGGASTGEGGVIIKW